MFLHSYKIIFLKIFNRKLKGRVLDFIGWIILLISKIIRVELDFDETRLLFYDKYILFSRITEKNF